MLLGLELDVVTELWPREVIQEVDVMLFSRGRRVICLHL